MVGIMNNFSVSEVKSSMAAIGLCLFIHPAYSLAESESLQDISITLDNIPGSINDVISVKPFYKDGETDEGGYRPAGFVVKCADKVFVSYRGTATLKEDLHDAEIMRSKMKFGESEVYVYSGFKKEFESSKANRDKVIKELNIQDDIPVIFTGHHGSCNSTNCSVR